MDIFLDIATKLAVILLLYIILYRALDNLRYRTRALIIFSLGMFLSAVFLFAYIFDVKNETVTNAKDYFIYIAINFVIGIFHLLYNFIKYKHNKFLDLKVKKQRSEPISKIHFKEFLYLVFEYENEYLLKEDKETYSSMILALKKGKFHDEEINVLLKRHKALNAKVSLFGKYIDSNNKEIYYTYLINLKEKIEINKYQYIHNSKIAYLNMSDLNKQFIFRVVIKEKFDIEN